MQIESENLSNNILKVILNGRLDLQGAQAIDMKFTAMTATKDAPILVDLSGVTFLASLGMRTLLSAAQAVNRRGGMMVLLKPQPNVLEVLTASGVSTLIPTFDDSEAAIATLMSHSKD